jgi:hypothetical protein
MLFPEPGLRMQKKLPMAHRRAAGNFPAAVIS